MPDVDLNSPENPLGNNPADPSLKTAGEATEELSRDLNLGDRGASLPTGIFAHSPNDGIAVVPLKSGTTANPSTLGNSKVEPLNKSEIPSVRTYKGDVQRAVTDHNISLASVVIKEEDKRRREAGKIIGGSRTNIVAIVLALVLLTSGAGIFGYFFLLREKPTRPGDIPSQIALPEPLLFSDTQTILDVTGLEDRSVRFRLDTIIGENLRVGSVKNVVLTETQPFGQGDRIVLVNGEEVFSKFGLSVPERLPRLFAPQFMLGIYSFKKNSAFLLFNFENYQAVFSEMLSWEKTMSNEIYPLLSGENSPADIKTAIWEDEVIQNIDTRVLRNVTGAPYILYSFLGTRNTLVITTEVDTLNEVRTRIQTPRGVTR